MTRTARRRRGQGGTPQRARAAHDTREQVDAADVPATEDERGSLWHSLLHDRSVRSRVAALVIVPLLGTLVLGTLFFRGALEDATSAGDVERLASVGVVATDALHRIQDERDVTAIAEAGEVGVAAVAEARDATDAALDRLRGELDDIPDAGQPVEAALARLESELGELSTYRSQRDDADPAFDEGGAEAYHDVAEAIRAIVTAAGSVAPDGDTAQLVGAVDNASRAVESASMERALVGYYLEPGEEPSAELTASAVTYRGEQELLFDRLRAGASDSAQRQELTERLDGANEFTAGTLEQIHAGDEVSASHEEWFDAASERLAVLRDLEGERAAAVVDDASSAAGGAWLRAIVIALVVVAVLLLTIFLAVVVARSIVGPLRRLRGAAQQTASKDLPAFVERLHKEGPSAAAELNGSGTPTVIEAEGQDEIGEVAKSFNDVHAMAVQIASDQALLRQNLDTIVVNLSRRTQSLVDRQLGEIESLEQRERDPDQLSALFRIDHMATRVRRHAESLLVLAGVEEMRKQSSAAPVLDVVRAAAGEVEQYPRVKFGVMPTDLISSAAVDDITHMLAELIDNATEFSAPSTPVQVTSQPLLGGGLRIQVTDAGLGIPQEQLDQLNDRLANVGDIDVATSRTLGLYVVARLSAKHGIRVRLEPGTGGGTVAQVDLPANLIHSPLDSEVEASTSSTPTPEPFNTPAPWQSPMPAQESAPSTPPRTATPSLIDSEPPAATPEPPAPSTPPEPSTPSAPSAPHSEPAHAQSAASSGSDFQSHSGDTGELYRSDSFESTFPGSAQASQESPIFESVRSAWFSKESTSDWSSPADVGWRRAAEVLRSAEEAAHARWNQQEQAPASPSSGRSTSIGSGWAASTPAQPDPAAGYGSHAASAGQAQAAQSHAGQSQAPASPAAASPASGQAAAQSSSGLPVRRRGASLVPGSISDPSAGSTAPRQPSAPTKSADSVSSTLASLQRGVGRGRQETGGWVPKRPGDPERSKQ